MSLSSPGSAPTVQLAEYRVSPPAPRVAGNRPWPRPRAGVDSPVIAPLDPVLSVRLSFCISVSPCVPLSLFVSASLAFSLLRARARAARTRTYTYTHTHRGGGYLHYQCQNVT